MTLSFVSALIWLVVANLVGMVPSKRKHWPQAYVLIAIGLPVLAWVWAENGVLWAGLILVAAVSILRWPVRYLVRWLRRIAIGDREKEAGA